MTDQPKESKGDKPPFDPHKLLDQLKSIVKSSTGSPATDGGGGSAKSWVGALIVFAVVLVGIAVWSWISWRRGRELAKLRHEKNKTRILADKAEVYLLVAKGNEAIAAELKIIDAAEDNLRAIEADIEAEEARYEADMRAIDSIRSWSDAGIR